MQKVRFSLVLYVEHVIEEASFLCSCDYLSHDDMVATSMWSIYYYFVHNIQKHVILEDPIVYAYTTFCQVGWCD